MRSNETIVIMQTLKALQLDIEGVRVEVREVMQYLHRLEENGITLNLPILDSDASDTASEDEAEEDISMV